MSKTLSWVLLLTGIVSGRNSIEVISSRLEGARWRKERSSPDDNPQPSLPVTKKLQLKCKITLPTFFKVFAHFAQAAGVKTDFEKKFFSIFDNVLEKNKSTIFQTKKITKIGPKNTIKRYH